MTDRLDLPAFHPADARDLGPVRIRIPEFPAFKALEIEDQFEVEQWVKRFPPYSDFNFVSLWSWNTSGGFELSWLNDNLVVLFNDYGTGERFFSFLGANQPDETADALLDLAKERGIVRELRLLPAETARRLTPRRGLHLAPVPEHDDYILSTVSWSTLAGGQFRNKRNEISKLERLHRPVCRQIDLGDSTVQQAVADVYGRWSVRRERAGAGLPESTAEALAVRRVFSLDRPGDLLGFGLFVDDEMVAYSINERLGRGYAMGHHWKADPAYPGAYPYLLRETCRTLAAEGVTFLNIQQDLGEPGLATAKRLYRPARRLHKFQLSVRELERDDPAGEVIVIGTGSMHGAWDWGWNDSEHVG
ncbi:MAG: GNAT family N-acetyltransferase [Thermomicrobiales bacterium]|nr:GNAT family N-acetyltransferase [Thermomicrobiales bacterium]